MHRFFTHPSNLHGHTRAVWLESKEDADWRYTVKQFRAYIKERDWRTIDGLIKLTVKVDAGALWEALETRTDYYLASAYLKACILEGTAIIVYADDTIPWALLKPFKFTHEPNRTKGRGQADTSRAINTTRETQRLTSKDSQGMPGQAQERPGKNGTGQCGAVSSAGSCRCRPRTYNRNRQTANLGGAMVKPSSRECYAGRQAVLVTGSTGHSADIPVSVKRVQGETLRA